MKKPCVSCTRLCLAVLLLAASSASGSEDPGWQPPILPDRGMYYTPEHGGTGINLDVDPNGYIFATFYTYDADGRPTFYLMEGPFQPASDITADADRFHRNQIGSFDATLYTSRNGECLGADCVYRNPDRTLTGHKAHMVWITQRHARLSIDTQSWDLRAGQYTSADTDKIAGTWAATLTESRLPDSGLAARVAVLKIRKGDYPPESGSGSSAAYEVYDVACAGASAGQWDMQSVCPDFYAALTRDQYGGGISGYALLYHVDDGSMQLLPYRLVDGRPQFLDSRGGLIFQMELTPRVMRGREILIGDTGVFETHNGSLDMIRVADGAFDAATTPAGTQ
ncbi:MAG: hypothetical protein WCD66_00930 [Rhodanobacteraceae bacterium]